MSYSAKRKIFILLLMAGMVVYFARNSSTFLTPRNIGILLQETSIWGIAAIGVTFVMISGGMDLSIGAIIAFSTMLTVNFMVNIKLPLAVYAPLVLAAGTLIGYFNGFIITRLKLIDFIVTLSTKGIISGLALIIAIKEAGFVKNVYISDKEFLGLFAHRFTVPWLGNNLHAATPAFLLAAVIAYIALSRMPIGTYVYAIGSNPNSAILSGVSIKRVKAMVFMISGFCCALTAMFLAARVKSAMPDMGLDMEMDVVAAVIIGGTAFKGGSGDIHGTVMGMLFLQLLKNGIFKFHVAPAWQPIIIGGVITVTVIFDETYKRIAARVQESRYDAEVSTRTLRKRDGKI